MVRIVLRLHRNLRLRVCEEMGSDAHSDRPYEHLAVVSELVAGSCSQQDVRGAESMQVVEEEMGCEKN